MNTMNSLLEKIENSKTLDFGDIFSKSIELFKKVWVQGLVMLLLMIVILLPFYLIMYLPLIGIGFLDAEAYQFNNDMSPLLMIPFFIMIFIFSIVAMVLSFGMKASFYRICKLKDLNEAGSDDYILLFKKNIFRKSHHFIINDFWDFSLGNNSMCLANYLCCGTNSLNKCDICF